MSETNLPAPAGPRLPAPADMTATAGKLAGIRYSSLDPSDPTEATALYQVLNGQGGEFRDQVGKELRIRHVIIRDRARVKKDDGEEVFTTVASVVAEDGAVISGTSIGVVESLIYLLACRGAGPWTPPAVVRVTAVNAGQGKLLKLDLIDLGLTKKDKTGKK